MTTRAAPSSLPSEPGSQTHWNPLGRRKIGAAPRVMSNELVKTEFTTAEGAIWLWHGASALTSAKPVLLTITGAFAPEKAMSKIQSVVGDGCEAVLMNLPGNHCPWLADRSVAAVSRALEEVIRGAFAERPVVLLGLSIGALVAVGVDASPVRRIVAVEPPLTSAKLWPMIPSLRKVLGDSPSDRDMHAFIDQVFGVTPEGVTDRRYFHLFERLRVPVDVVLGDDPLFPTREVQRLPSLVDEPDRDFLRAQPGVAVTLASGAGHNVPYQAAQVLKDVLLRALRAATGASDLPPLHEALLARTPIAARALAYRGGDAPAFQARCRLRQPHAVFDAPAALQALVFDDLAAFTAAPGGVERLAPDGVLVAAIPAGAAERLAPLLQAVEAAGLDVLELQPAETGAEFFDDPAADLAPGWQARRMDRGQASRDLILVARRRRPEAPPVLRLCFATFAPRLMDIRTRLPTHALRSEPELRVTYGRAPVALPAAPADEPKIQILQRPALLDPAAWRNAMDACIRAGWIVVMEYDDHPELVAEVKKRVMSDADWLRFGYVHAVQTSTPALAEAFLQYNPETRVFANSVFELEPFPASPPRRVFYGAVSRGAFAAEVARGLAPATAEFPDVEFVVIGDRAVFEALPTRSKRFYDYLPYDDYLRLMGTCSVSLSPIEGRRHQETKSDAKFLDAASRGALTIASPTIYEGVIRHGETGLIARTAGDWAPLLARALRDEADRRRMAEAAWRYVRDERMFADQIAARRDWYRDLWARREALNAAVAARLPQAAPAA